MTSLLKARESSRLELVKAVNDMIESPLLFGVCGYKGYYHGNRHQMRESKFFRNRKIAVEKASVKFKKIEELCFFNDILSKKHRTKIEDIISDCNMFKYSGANPAEHTQIIMEKLSDEIKTEYNKKE